MLHKNAENKQLYFALCDAEPGLNFQIVESSDNFARVELLDKVGYAVIELNGSFLLVDADDTDIVESFIDAKTFATALEVAIKEIGWRLSEPQEYIGGTLGSGFGLEETGE